MKQRHIRTVLRDGEPSQEIITERILMQQHGDDPPPELQDKIDKLADYFRSYDIRPPSPDTSMPPNSETASTPDWMLSNGSEQMAETSDVTTLEDSLETIR